MILTEKKRIKINTECIEDPVYLCWLNRLGGKSYWLFGKKKQERSRTRLNESYDKNISDLETAYSTNDIIGKSSVRPIKIGARIAEGDIDGITGLHESSKVLMLMNPETWQSEGAKWQRVIINPGSLLILETGTRYYDVVIELQPPYKFTQSE